MSPRPRVAKHGTRNEYGNYGCRCAACRRAASEYQRRHNAQPCVECGKPTWSAHRKARTGLCRACAQALRASTVRDDTLRCSECGEWKPDEEFGRQQSRMSRRGRHSVCRACAAAARQRSRLARMVPCTGCGEPRMHPKDTGNRHPSTGLCRKCWGREMLWRKRSAA